VRRRHSLTLLPRQRSGIYHGSSTHNCQCGSVIWRRFDQLRQVSYRTCTGANEYHSLPQKSNLMSLLAFYSLWTACAAVAFLLIVSAVLQLSLISAREWKSLFSRVDRSKKFARSFMARSMSCDALRSPLKRSSRILRRLSTFDHDKNPTGESGAGSFVGETIFDKVKRD